MRPFFDRHLLRHLGLTVLVSALVVWLIKVTPSIHYPFFVVAALAAGLGWLEPRRGWSLALTQIGLVWLGYTFLTNAPTQAADRDVEAFSLYGSFGLVLVSSALGGLLKRTLDRP